MSDPPATLDEPDTDVEVIIKLRAEIERLTEQVRNRDYALDRLGELKDAEIERLTAFLYRISGANDNPSCFNPNVEAVLVEWRALEGK